MHVLITGGTGFIGKALVPALLAQGTTVTVLSRLPRESSADLRYVTDLGQVKASVDAVINLAGASLADKRWSEAYKAEIVASRVQLTQGLVDWMASLVTPPKVLLSGSAIGYYGHSDDAEFSEQSPAGAGFSADLCQQWESAALRAEAFGTRVVLLRLGVVFDRDGGALDAMMQSFKMGVGSWVGSGKQWLSWVHRWDVVRAIQHLLASEQAVGAYNVTAPHPVTHKVFAKILAARKPTLINIGVPAFAMRLLVGEMANELLLEGQRVLPTRLTDAGFTFNFGSLDSALIDILSRTKPR